MIAVMHQWFSNHLPEDGSVTLEDISDETAILALQGPQAKDVLVAVLGEGAHVDASDGRPSTALLSASAASSKGQDTPAKPATKSSCPTATLRPCGVP